MLKIGCVNYAPFPKSGLTYVTYFAKPATYAHYGKEKFSSPTDSSINKLITSTPLPNVYGSAFAEAYF